MTETIDSKWVSDGDEFTLEVVGSRAEALEVFERGLVPFFSGFGGVATSEVDNALSELAEYISQKGAANDPEVSSAQQTLVEAKILSWREMSEEDRDNISKKLGQVRKLLERI